MDLTLLASSIVDATQVFAQVAVGAAFKAGSGYNAGKLRWTIVIVTAIATIVWATWATWGRFEAYHGERINLKNLLFDLIGIVIVTSVMMGILFYGGGPVN